MANNPSAIKRIRQTATKTDRNRAHVSAMRTAVKKFRSAVESGEGDLQELYKLAAKELDSAATKGLIHKNKAARDKSRLAKLVK
ncbi:30S ribosomal protein S20 [Aerococcaceae bacterium zg-ZJ1578]|uniref:30S ribosomal protein S20 n=1 Tax=Aerococcaceae TaxID=186827 RepID=UPI0013B7F9ED|nr:MULTISPECIES: 30S ribosomal protein S20 [unclassified Facklamia]MBK0347792.1 30S ribosomal protein S20 [Aerococcaceae bacterium zg-1578]MBR7927419.1 30S ribosomal protein S20 [Aerococcaceae bacterium zg-ZUI334]MBS4461377.1 30S ribosomal protein S20 [Aerococcaceae bacterium zg-B36]QQD65855.1 30S ribosomal protein S20 [Aerococcaceae bacterium zg-252]NEW64149.1 30S ribosomal protein S20 [Facklamia sp. 252]